jgi:8-oxo-dGTP diphosphatase
MKPHLIVTAAIIQKNGQVLCARRAPGKSQAGLWEFPGGKVEDFETDEACLARELKEELGLTVTVGEKFATNVHEYDDKIVELRAYWVKSYSGEITLVDHDASKWLPIGQLTTLTWAPADVPFIEALTAQL